MKKRQRKKLYLGDFREDCFSIQFQLDAGLSADKQYEFFDRFIEMIENSRLQFGGGGSDSEWSGIVEYCGRGTATDEHRGVVVSWLNRQREVVDCNAGALVDAWYGS